LRRMHTGGSKAGCGNVSWAAGTLVASRGVRPRQPDKLWGERLEHGDTMAVLEVELGKGWRGWKRDNETGGPELEKMLRNVSRGIVGRQLRARRLEGRANLW
jgi:hypothetical protein